MKFASIATSLFATIYLAASPLAGHAQGKQTELRYTSGAPPKGNPWVMQIERFAKDVDEESKGTIKIAPFLSSQLGSEQDTVQQVARGRIDMGGFSAGSAALVVPEVALLLMPFYFNTTAELDCVLDHHMTKTVADLYAKKGIQFLGWTEVGTIDLVGKKPYLLPKDLQGAKAASYANKTQALFYAAFGANANPLGLPEWIPAMQTGLAEVVMTTITSALPMGLTKVAPVISRLGLYDAPALTLMNKRVYDGLGKDQQEALVRATARNPAEKARAEVRNFEGVLFGIHEKSGGQAIAINAAQRAEWRKAMEPVYGQIVKETGGASDSFYTAMESGRKACTK
jgi:TRAP-type C4-dicarboxylate transport system substrate-binding protein